VDISYGQQVTPPTLLFEISKFPTGLALGGKVTRITITNGGSGYTSAPAVNFSGGGGASATATVKAGVVTAITIVSGGSGYISAPAVSFSGGGGSGAAAVATLFHEINGDAILPEVFYDLLTNKLYGAGIDPANLITQKFLDGANQIVAENLGVSPVIDQNDDMRAVVGKLLQYIDGIFYLDQGAIAFKLVRKESTSGLLSISESDFIDEPKPDNKGFADTWNFTLLKFTDRNNKWEQGIETYDDAANSAVVAESVPKELNFAFITRRDAAKVVAKNVGIKGGLPPMFWNVRLLPRHAGIKPGQLLFFSYAKRGIVSRLARCMEVIVGGPSSPEVEVNLMEEMTRDVSHDYTPPADAFEVAPRIGGDGTANFDVLGVSPRLLILPGALKAGKADGWLTAMNRPDRTADSNKTFWTFDETKKAYQQVDTRLNFPIKGELLAWWKFRTNSSWLLRIKFPQSFDFDALGNLAANAPEFFFVAARRIVRETGSIQDEHQVDGLWCQKIESGYLWPVNSVVWDLEVSAAAAFGSLPLLLETIANPGNYPTLHCYLGRRDDFAIVTSDTINFERPGPNAPDLGSIVSHGSPVLKYDTDLKRIVKVTVANFSKEQQLSDALAVSYDRDDPAMCAAGTFSTTWGAKALTGYELFDNSGGGRVDPGVEDGDYSNISDLDEALGATFDDLANDQQALLSESIDLVLGYMVQNNSLIYSDAP